MEDMDFDSGLAFSFNEKETVNFKNSDSLILLPDSKELFFWGFNVYSASHRSKQEGSDGVVGV